MSMHLRFHAALAGMLVLATGASAQSFIATPLNCLRTGTYKGFEGGLYENGTNTVPSDHDADGRAIAAQIAPIDGKTVFMSVGMSNANFEFGEFITQANADPGVNHTTLAIVNGAYLSAVACDWTVATGDPYPTCGNTHTNEYDRVRDDVLAPAGLAEDQVEVVWMEEADPSPMVALPAANADAYVLETYLGDIARAAQQRYLNLKLMLVSSRIYAGYATTKLNPEPYAYESGFSMKWLIEAQINQIRTCGSGTCQVDPIAGNLNYNSAYGAVVAPWIAWSAYAWADGMRPRCSDGLEWLQSDFGSDGTHPDKAGDTKWTNLELPYFKASPYTVGWFAERP